ncbi:histone H1.4-like [Heterodontus francisci]|uniref:histone H1.4-like n=1 Tax=Heterodontus francisci TaxID=7792 RepID=UPI00355C047C
MGSACLRRVAMPRLPRAPAGNAPRKKQQQQRKLRPYRRQRKKYVRISQLILQALSARKQRGGLSLASLRKALLASGYDAESNMNRVQLAIKSLVSSGTLVQTKATGSFKLSERQEQLSAESGRAELPAKEEGPAPAAAAASTGEEANAGKKPRKRRAEGKAKPRKPKK